VVVICTALTVGHVLEQETYTASQISGHTGVPIVLEL